MGKKVYTTFVKTNRGVKMTNRKTTMTYKEARSFNRKLRNSWLADNIETEEYHAKEIDMSKFIRYELTTDAHLPVAAKAYFHVANPNGLGALLSDDEKFGYDNFYARYHYKELQRLMLLKRPGVWNVNYHIRELEKAINKKQEVA